MPKEFLTPTEAVYLRSFPLTNTYLDIEGEFNPFIESQKIDWQYAVELHQIELRKCLIKHMSRQDYRERVGRFKNDELKDVFLRNLNDDTRFKVTETLFLLGFELGKNGLDHFRQFVLRHCEGKKRVFNLEVLNSESYTIKIAQVQTVLAGGAYQREEINRKNPLSK